MDLLSRTLSELHLNCLDGVMHTNSVKRSERKARLQRGSSSWDSSDPHCQYCISYGKRLKRLSCGHTYCGACADRIVNEAFQDIEGLSEFPCPMCKSIQRLGSINYGAM